MTPENTNTSPILTDFMERVGNAWSDDDRQLLKPYLPLTVGTGGDGRDGVRRFILADWGIRTVAPLALDKAGFGDHANKLRSLDRVVGVGTVRVAWSAARSVASRIVDHRSAYEIVDAAAEALAEVVHVPRHYQLGHSSLPVDAVLDGPLAGEVSVDDMLTLLRRLIEANDISPISDRHRWFAWHPVLTPTGRKWMKTVIRQRWGRPTGRTNSDGQIWWWTEEFWRYADLS